MKPVLSKLHIPNNHQKKHLWSWVLQGGAVGPYAHAGTTIDILIPSRFVCYLLAFSIPTLGPHTYAAAAKSTLSYGQLRVLSGLVFPSLLFLVKMMGNFSQDKVVEGQPGECWIVTDIISFWWTLMSYGVLRGKYITRTSWENIMTGPCNSRLYSWELNVHTSCLLHCTPHIK